MRAFCPSRMPPLVLTALLGAALVLITGCSADGSGTNSNGKLTVAATTPQIGALAHEVGGDDITLVTLLAAGADPHEFQPKSSHIRKLSGAAVMLKHGIRLDDWLDEMLANNKSGTVVTVTEGIALLKGVGAEAGRDDPHVWHDPTNDKVMVDNIARALSAADVAHADAYAQRAASYKAKLDTTDAEIQQLIASIPAANRKMVTNHDAFGYFIKRYGLQYVGAVIPSTSTQAETSAKDLADLENAIKAQGVRAIFAESSLEPKVAKRIAEDTKVKIVDDLYGDSLGKKGSGADTVDGMLLANARKIAEALK